MRFVLGRLGVEVELEELACCYVSDFGSADRRLMAVMKLGNKPVVSWLVITC